MAMASTPGGFVAAIRGRFCGSDWRVVLWQRCQFALLLEVPSRTCQATTASLSPRRFVGDETLHPPRRRLSTRMWWPLDWGWIGCRPLFLRTTTCALTTPTDTTGQIWRTNSGATFPAVLVSLASALNRQYLPGGRRVWEVEEGVRRSFFFRFCADLVLGTGCWAATIEQRRYA